MTKKVLWTSLIIAILFLSACAKAAPTQVSPENEKLLFDQRGVAEAPSAMDSAGAPQAPQPTMTTGNSATGEFKQMIIMNASLEIAVDDPGAAMSAIQKMA